MIKTVFQILALAFMIAATSLTAFARQSVIVQAQLPRGAGQPPSAKQGQQIPQNLTADKPNPPKRNEQQQKNRVANAIVDRYLGGFQNQVGLDDAQTRKFSGILGNYVRRQLILADRKNEALKRLKELDDQKASEEEIQAQYKILDTTEAQQINVTRRFYADVNPQLSIQQQARLKVYMDSTEQDVRQAIQKSR